MLGAGKVGRALWAALRAAGVAVRLFPARSRLAPALWGADVVLVAVRDPELPRVCAELARLRAAWLGRTPRQRPEAARVLLHCAGGLGLEALAGLRQAGVAVGQFHPLLAMASASHPPALAGAAVHLGGDARARAAGRQLARRLGLRPFSAPKLPPAAYHGAASLLAGGTVALFSAAVELLVAEGIDPSVAARLLGPLLGSVAHNVTTLGLPRALTGPIRRGDARAVHGHLEALRRRSPSTSQLYEILARIQLGLARELGEASPAALGGVARILQHNSAH